MTSSLKDQSWFSESWATDLRDAVRVLVRDYADAVESVERLAKPIERVTYKMKLGNDRSVWIVKFLLKQATINHIQTVSRVALSLIAIRAFSCARPTRFDFRPTAKNPSAEAIAQRDELLERQKTITTLLNGAIADIQSLLKAVGSTGRPGQRFFKAVLTVIWRIVPLAWAGFVIIQFRALSNVPQWQLFAYAAMATAAYHVFAWLTLAFHDAADRQFILFEGYRRQLAEASDGIPLIHPEVSRHENAVFKLFGCQRPIVVSWEILVPPIHYAVISFLLVAMLVELPFVTSARVVAGVLSAGLIAWYAWQIRWWWRLMRSRYEDYAVVDIAYALISGALSLLPETDFGETDDSAKLPDAKNG